MEDHENTMQRLTKQESLNNSENNNNKRYMYIYYTINNIYGLWTWISMDIISFNLIISIFIDEKTGSEMLRHLPEIGQLVSADFTSCWPVFQ